MTRPDRWDLADIPDQAGRTVLVTGTTVGGLGHHTSLELARRGARVVLTGRSPDRLAETEQAILDDVPTATLETIELDLADLSSVRRAAATASDLGPIDVLVNNAGVMGTPYQRTADGLELQLATNHYGPFLLTGLLLPQLVASEDGSGRLGLLADAPDRALGAAGRPAGAARPLPAVADLRAVEAGQPAVRLRARPAAAPRRAPGARRSPPTPASPRPTSPPTVSTVAPVGGRASILDGAIRLVSPNTAAQGAWPTLMAATADLPGATYVGPDGLMEWGGRPRVTTSNKLSYDETAQRRLWQLSEQTTGITYP